MSSLTSRVSGQASVHDVGNDAGGRMVGVRAGGLDVPGVASVSALASGAALDGHAVGVGVR